jgi:Holliday junction resolvase RusA-like endonuclease
MKIRFTVMGKPQGKGRPRFTMTGHAYTPERTREYEELVRRSYLKSARDQHFSNRAVMVEILAFFPIPKRANKQDRSMMEAGELFPTSKPDCDNIIKIVCDALNGIAYRDDSQVVAVTCQKRYGVEPAVHVVVTDWSEY